MIQRGLISLNMNGDLQLKSSWGVIQNMKTICDSVQNFVDVGKCENKWKLRKPIRDNPKIFTKCEFFFLIRKNISFIGYFVFWFVNLFGIYKIIFVGSITVLRFGKVFFGIDYLFNDDFQKYYDLHFFGSRISDFGNILGLSLIGFRRKCSFTCVEKCRTPYV